MAYIHKETHLHQNDFMCKVSSSRQFLLQQTIEDLENMGFDDHDIKQEEMLIDIDRLPTPTQLKQLEKPTRDFFSHEYCSFARGMSLVRDQAQIDAFRSAKTRGFATLDKYCVIESTTDNATFDKGENQLEPYSPLIMSELAHSLSLVKIPRKKAKKTIR